MSPGWAVGAHDFIAALDHGYETLVGEGGAILSGGQRQLISFARALLADQRILILDEATSSVDTQTERVIQAALQRVLKERTAFVLAYRLSTITRADVIVEAGTHAELLDERGQYFELYTMAFAGRAGRKAEGCGKVSQPSRASPLQKLEAGSQARDECRYWTGVQREPVGKGQSTKGPDAGRGGWAGRDDPPPSHR